MGTTYNAVRVVVVDDHPLHREGAQACLDAQDGIRVVATVGTARAALLVVRGERPDVLLLDVHLPDRSGIEVARAVRAEQPGTAILVLTGYDDLGYAQALVRLGVRGYLPKTATCAEIAAAVRAVAAGDRVLSERALLAESQGDPNLLTARELQILRLVTEARRNGEIADELRISVKTVEFHLGHIFEKLGARSRLEAVARGRSLGLVAVN
jgi:DNA-binding NarL/FixJ family response regulator